MDKVINFTIILMFLVGMTMVIMTAGAQPVTDRMGFPPGYVGGELMPNGDVRGGHPSEEVMERDFIEAGGCTNNREVFERMGVNTSYCDKVK